MLTVSKSELKAKMLEYFRHIEQTGEELTVTSNKIPTFEVMPYKKNKTVQEVFGDLRGKIKLDDSIMIPETDEWNL